MTTDEVKAEIRSLDWQTREIVMLFLDLLLQSEQTGKALPKVPENEGDVIIL